MPANIHVLLVEDNQVNQKVACALLKKPTCIIDVAVDGGVAMEMLREHTFDLILMDCQLPVIAMTANAMQGDREQCLAAGMDDYLPKPVSRDNIVATLLRWTRHS